LEEQLSNTLNDLCASIIESYEFDILENTISFDLKTIDNGCENKYKMIFSGVSTWYFVKDTSEKRLNTMTVVDEDDHLELTSIDFYEEGIVQINPLSTEENWVNHYYSNANFALEIWNALLLVEAKTIVINGYKYNVS